MKQIIMAAILLAFIGCNSPDTFVKNIEKDTSHFGLQLVSIDSCEYVLFVSSSAGSSTICHSGNCHNPKHNNK